MTVHYVVRNAECAEAADRIEALEAEVARLTPKPLERLRTVEEPVMPWLVHLEDPDGYVWTLNVRDRGSEVRDKVERMMRERMIAGRIMRIEPDR